MTQSAATQLSELTVFDLYRDLHACYLRKENPELYRVLRQVLREQEDGFVKQASLCSYLGISISTLERRIAALKLEGVLVTQKVGRSRCWYMVPGYEECQLAKKASPCSLTTPEPCSLNTEISPKEFTAETRAELPEELAQLPEMIGNAEPAGKSHVPSPSDSHVPSPYVIDTSSSFLLNTNPYVFNCLNSAKHCSPPACVDNSGEGCSLTEEENVPKVTGPQGTLRGIAESVLEKPAKVVVLRPNTSGKVLSTMGHALPKRKPSHSEKLKGKAIADYNCNDLLHVFRVAFLEANFKGARLDWGPKERNCMKGLIAAYGSMAVLETIAWLFENWPEIQKRYKISSPIPSVGMLAGYKDSWVPEALNPEITVVKTGPAEYNKKAGDAKILAAEEFMAENGQGHLLNGEKNDAYWSAISRANRELQRRKSNG